MCLLCWKNKSYWGFQMGAKMKKITIEIKESEVGVNIGGVTTFTDLLVGLATLEGIIGGIMEADKVEVRTAVDEIQKELQHKLPEGAKN